MRCLATIILICCALPLAAEVRFTPQLDLITPRGAMRGTELDLQLHGKRLDQPLDLLFQRTGIELLGFRKDGKRWLAKVRIAKDAPLGEYPMRLRTAGGISYLRSFWVGQYPSLAETEPNSSFDTAQKIELNRTITGVSKREDEDYFLVHLKKGEPLSVEVEAMRLARQFFDVYMAILDPNGVVIAACDDATLLRTDAFVSIVAPEDGDYRILIREAAYEGNDRCQYRLHVGRFPRPTGVFPPAARAGESLEFRFVGDPAGELTQTITIPSDASGHHPVHAERDGHLSPSPNWIRISSLPTVTDTEPNNYHKKSQHLPSVPHAVNGVLEKGDPTDDFRFTAKKGQQLNLRVFARSLRSPLDAVLSLRNAQGKGIANNDDQNGLDPFLKWRCPADGEYSVSVRDKLGRGGPDFIYRLEIDHRPRTIRANLPSRDRNNSQHDKVICVPRGNRFATVVNVVKGNHNRDASFSPVQLPAGVHMIAHDIPGSTNSFPVLFTADRQAPLEGGRYDFIIRAKGDDTDIHGPLEQVVHQVEVNNQGPYHTNRSDRIPVAVIEEAPFEVRLETPSAPVVPRGQMKLKVRAKRAKGFDEAIQIQLPWKPPGIGAPDRVTIPKGKDSAEYEINANADAKATKWPILVTAKSNTKQGPVSVASSFVSLEITDPFVGASIELTTTERGQDVNLQCKLDPLKAFKGQARAELIGLPHGASSPVQKFSHGKKTLNFPIKVAKDAAVGRHSGLFLRIEIPHGNSTIRHHCGHGGVLRIDNPEKELQAGNS